MANHHLDSISSTHAPSDAIIVPDADLLFNGDFKRSGVDLIVSRDDHELVVPDYFKGEKRAALASPDGAKLTGDIVNALAGHVEIAQADGSAGAGKVIGHVTKLTGTATAIRNGVSIILNQGDNVEKGDVVQSGSASTLGVTFIDGTVFGLSANARMVLNEMVYDPNGSSNSSLISLVAGTISFVAGQTAKHGDMKIDTPVATMGIRGTAVLVEIDFDVPGQNGTPEAKFQVLVEPDGTTGSYILFDKNTLAPIAVVDKAGQQVHISDNNVSFSNSPLTPELQKLITDVFTLKFSNTNPQSFTHFTDTLTPQQMWLPVQLANSGPPAVVHVAITPVISGSGTSSGPPPSAIPHINQPPVVTTIDASLAERAHLTGSSAVDTASGTIGFFDINLGDRPTAKATISSFTYQDAQHQDIAASPQELADIHALEAIPLVMVQAPGNTYKGAATWTLHVPDKAFDFLGAGDTLTLTYTAEVDSNYGGGNLAGFANFTVTITGTNDAPVITTAAENVAFVNVGTSTTGPNLPVDPTTTTNTLKFKDVDLTDTHTVTADLTGATLSETGGQTLDMQALETKFPRPMDVFESALSAAVTTDSTGTGAGTITWTLADISSYYADIVPKGETLTLTYTVTVKDSQGATSSQTVTVTITGSDAPAVVWVETQATSGNDAAPGDWNGAGNWETGTVPIDTDDVIIITNQLQGQTPLYPVTIKSVADGGVAAAAHSLTMNDYGTPFTNSPTLINNNTLTVGAGGVSLSADAILKNFGTLSLGGLLEVLQESSLQNNIGALITLHDGGDFNDSGSFTDSNSVVHSGSVTNAGTIDLAGGILNVEVAVANAGGTIQIDPGATLKLNGGAIDGGTITDNGTIDVTGNSKIDSSAALNNGAVTVENGATLTLDGMTVNGTAITDKGAIVLDGTVQLTGNATLEGASISALGAITNNGTLEVAGAAELLNDTLTNTNGIIQIDALQTLTLSGTEIIGGAINGNGKIDITGNSKIDSGATLNNGAATVENGATLTLDGVTVNGTDVTDKGAIVLDGTVQLTGNATLEGASISALGAITNNGTLEVSGAASLLNDTLTNTSGIILVDALQTLTLSGTEIIGGTITDNNTIDVTGNSKIDSGATLNNGAATVENGATLTLDGMTVNGTAITDKGAIVLDGTVQLTGNATLEGVSISAPGAITNNGTLEVSGAASLLNDILTNSSGIIQVDGSQILSLSGTEIIGGAINGNGKIDVTGNSKIDSGATLHNGAVSVENGATLTLSGMTVNGTAITDKGTILLDGTVQLTGNAILQGASISALGAITNNGTLEVAGAAELLNDTLTNSSGIIQVDASQILTLSGTEIIGGTINDNNKIEITGSSKIDSGATLNSGAATVENGATLTLDGMTVNGTDITDEGTIVLDGTVKLTGSATIEGASSLLLGKITNDGTLEVSGAASLLNDTLTNTNGIIQVDDSQILTLSGTEIIGGAINGNGKIDITGDSKIDSGATLHIGAATVENGATLTLSGIAVNGTATTDKGTIVLDKTVQLTGGATLEGASISALGAITNNGTLEAAGAAELLNDTLTNTNGIIQVDDSQILTLSGTEIIGGIINDFSGLVGGTIDVTGDSKIDSSATLNSGAVTVEPNVTLTLDGMTVNGTAITDKGAIVLDKTVQLTGGATLQGASISALGAITNNGTLEVAGAASLLNDTLTNSSGIIQVDASQILTLSGTEIISGAINGNGKIDITGDSKIDSGATLHNGAATVENGATLTLSGMTVNGTDITDKGAIVLDGTVQLTGNATLEGASISALGKITNNGTLEVSGAASLLNDTLTNSSGIIQVDDSQILTLSGTEIIGGTINDFSGLTGGKIDVTGNSKIDSDATLNNGAATVENGATLTLDGMTVNGTAITDEGAIVLDGTVQLAGSAILQGASISARGAITNNGTLEVAGAAELLNDTLTNTNGIIQVDDGQTLTLSGIEIIGGIINDFSGLTGGTIDVTGNSKIDGSATLNDGSVTVESGMTLTLDDVTVNGTKFTDTATGGTIQIDSGHTLTFNGATIKGGTLTINGELDSTGNSFITDATIVNSSHIDVVSGTLTIDPTPVTNTGTIEVKGESTLVLSGETVANSAAGVSGTIQVDATDSTHFATLDLAGSTITGGKLIIAGDLVSTGDSFINGATITNTGTIDVTGGTLTIDAASTIDNSTGTIETHGGHLIIDAALSGNIEIKGAATVELGASAPTAYSAATVTFDSGATGTLMLDHSQNFHGTISGFNAGDKIDLTDLAYLPGETDVWSSADDTLTINNGTNVTTLHFGSGYSQNSFVLTNVNGHTEVVSNPGGLGQPAVTVDGLDSAGNAVEGTAVTADFTPPGPGNPGTVTYTWLENGQVDAAVTGNTFTPGAADVGKVIDVVVGFGSEQITAVAGAVAAPPAISFNLANGATTNFNTPLTLNGLHLSFADAGSDSFTVMLGAGHGTLALANAAGVSESGTGATGSPLILTGTLAAIDTALGHGLVYTPTNGFSGSDTLSVSAKDGAFSSNTATLGVTVASAIMATINFDDAADGTSGTALSDYFATYGITLSANGHNAAPSIESDQSIYGGGIVEATTGHNVFGENGGNPVSYTVTFAHALTSFAFDRVQEDAGPNGSSYPTWTATAYDAEGHVLGTVVGENETSVFGSPVPAAHYVLTGADIAYVTFSGDDHGHDGVANVVTDSWVLTDAPVVPAATAAVWDNTSGDWNDTASQGPPHTVDHWTGVVTPTSSDDVTINAAGSPYTVAIGNNDSASADSLHLDSAAATIHDSGSLNLAGNLVIDHGAFEMDGGSLQAVSIQVASTGSFKGEGTINGPVSVSGVVEAVGTLDFANYVTGTGTFSIDPSSTLEFGGHVSAGSVISFANAAGQGTLHLDNASTFQGQVSGFAAGDVMDLGGLQASQFDSLQATSSAYNSATNTTLVTVTDNGQSTSVTLSGDYSNVLWAAGDDGHGGVNIAMDTVTMKLTNNGSVATDGSTVVRVTVLDGLTRQPLEGVTVTPSFTSDAGFGAFNGINAMAGDNYPRSTQSDGTADFNFQPFDFAGTFNISVLVGGAETLSQQLVIEPADASNSNSSLTSVLNFAGPTETATLTLKDQDFLHNARPGDTVGWSSSVPGGAFSPTSGVTDANGHLIDTFTPASDTQQTVTASFGDFGGTSVSTSVNFVTMDGWINTSGGTWNDAAHAGADWSEGHIPTAGEGVWIGAAGTYTVTVTDHESVFGLGTMATAALDIGNGGTLSVIGTGNSVIAGALTIDHGGEFLAQNGTVQLNGAVTNNNVLEAQSGATIDITNDVGGTGTIIADGAFVNAAGSLASTQAITITGAGIVHLAQAEAGQINFSGAGMLALDTAPAAGMTVHGFGLADSIDLTSLAYSSSETLTMSGNTLTIHDGAASESITFTESHSLSDFVLTADPLGTGGTDIVFNNNSFNVNGGSFSNVPLAGSTANPANVMGGISNNGVAIVTSTAQDYFFVNGHLVPVSGAPGNHGDITYDIYGSGINTSQQFTLSGAFTGTSLPAEIYTGTFDPSTGLNDGPGGHLTTLSFPSQLRIPGASVGEPLGINDKGQVVGFIENVTQSSAQQVPMDPPPNTGDPYQANVQNRYGFIYTPGSQSYVVVDAGNSASGVVPGAIDGGLSGVVFTTLTAINNNGIAVGYYVDNQSIQHAFVFNSNTHIFTFLPDEQVPYAETYPAYGGLSTDTLATGINDQGIVVGYYGAAFNSAASPLDPSGVVHGFVYDSVTNTFLNTPAGLGNAALTGINNLGMISGMTSGGATLFVDNLNPIVTIDNGGTLYVTTATNETIHFAGGTGELVLSHATDFHGHITGFTGTAPDAAHSDVIDLGGINFLTLNSPIPSESFQTSYSSTTGFLVVTDGLHTSASFFFDNYTGSLAYASDGHGGTLIFDPPAGPATIANGELYEVTSASSGTITFAGSTGALQLDNPENFTGTISGFKGDGTLAGSDHIDLVGIDHQSKSFIESFDAKTNTLDVSDGTNSAALHFNGKYQAADFSFASDGHGGTIIYDQPTPTSSATTSTIVASVPNQILTGTAASDTFVFNFANVGNAAVTNFHAEADVIQFSHQLFSNLQAALNAIHDDGHGNTVIALDAHDTITLNGTLKAQLQAGDFHFV